MPLYNTLNRKLILPASDLVLGNSIAAKFEFLNKSQWWSFEELEAFQEHRLRLLVAHAYENVPFYRERFDSLKLKPSDIRNKEDLKKLPILKKEDIRRAYPHAIIAKNLKKSELITGITSGSTGQPLQYFNTKESKSMWTAAGLRAWGWMGYQAGDTYAKLSQNPRKGGIKKLQDFVNRSSYIFIEHLSVKEFQEVCEVLIQKKPDYIRCYPDPLFFLAKYMLKNDIQAIQPKAINSTGNILYPEARKTIEQAFRTPVYDSYSCEGSPNISQAPGREVYLNSMEQSISEYLHEDGNDATTAEASRLIVTDLWNFASPFIRYETGDLVVKASKKPGCGRELEAIKQIIGRDSDVLVTPDGRLVIVHIFTIYFEWKESVDQFQVIQHSETEFEILLKVSPLFTVKEESEIRDYWKNYLGKNSKLNINVVDQITSAPSGKRKFLIRNPSVHLSL